MTAVIIVTGSRFLPPTGLVLATLDALDAELCEHLMIVHGQCDPRHPDTRRRIPWDRALTCGVHPDRLLGADWQAHRWAESTRVGTDPHPADWKKLGAAAGPVRNQAMVDAGARLCIAFPLETSAGTWDCARRARKAGIEVRWVPQTVRAQ